MKVMLQGLRPDADVGALADLLWDHTPDSLSMARHKVGCLQYGGTFMTMPEDVEWFLECAREFGIQSAILLGKEVHE